MRSCLQWEEPLALAAGGDLAPEERAAVDRHIAGCPACAEILAGLEQTVGSLHDAHAEPVAEAHFAALRARVLAQIQPRPRRRWLWAAAALGAAVLLFALSWPKPAPVPPPPLVAVAAPPAPPLAQPRKRSLAVAVGKRARTRAASVSEPLPAEPVTVKLLTDDPNVVIYWLGDPK